MSTPPTALFWHDPTWPAVVELRRAQDSRACYRPHSHPTVSIGAVDQGHSQFTGHRQAPQGLLPGAVVLVPAQVVHACNPAPDQAWSYQMLHLEAGWWAALRAECGLAPGPDEASVHRHQPALYRAFCRLTAQLVAPATPVADKEAALVDFLATRLWRLPAPAALPWPAAVPGLTDLLQALAEGEGPLPSLPALADRLGVSRFQLVRHFRHQTGLTPHAWLLNQRITRARAHLRAGAPLAELADQLGFADQSHFQRVFKAHAGVTPHGYRQRSA